MSADTAFARIVRPAAEVFAFMTDPAKLGLWSFGTWQVDTDPSGLITGTPITGGTPNYLRICPVPDHLLIDYLIGSSPDRLSPRIFARVTPGPVLGGSADECGLSMTAFRTDGMDDARWQSMIATHRVEMTLIRSAIETGYDHRLEAR